MNRARCNARQEETTTTVVAEYVCNICHRSFRRCQDIARYKCQTSAWQLLLHVLCNSVKSGGGGGGPFILGQGHSIWRDMSAIYIYMYKHWTGLVDWTSGLDWWTQLKFLFLPPSGWLCNTYHCLRPQYRPRAECGGYL